MPTWYAVSMPPSSYGTAASFLPKSRPEIHDGTLRRSGWSKMTSRRRTHGDSESLRVGQLVLAVGHPLGIKGALTTGIIHAINRAGQGGQQKWVQADLRLAPGNSGGPLANAWGQVIGINSMVAGGLALAVPSNAVERFLGATGRRAYLGVTTQPVQVKLQGTPALGLLTLR